MKRDPKARKKLLDSLQERAKELNCLYRVEEILSRSDETLDQVFQAIVEVMAPGWQYPDLCQAKITFDDRIYISSPFDPTPWVLSAGIFVQDRKVGDLRVYYLEERPDGDQGPFLNEEVRLINTIAQRLGHYILYQQI
ncbi:MAG: pyruvate, phosphate dikinase, partial [Candidatus Eisenbacteria bacterium]|nr:pyruvate, phosphate dikinase [Candidatus Eisenbacteria bacterium]